METESLTLDAEEQAMRDLGQATDQIEGRTPTQDQSAEPAEPRAPAEAEEEVQQPQPPETERPEQTPDSSETEPKQPELQQRTRDPVTGKFQKPDTEYTRAQKEEARKERSWQALQAEKERFRMQTTQWQEQQRMQQLEAARQSYRPLQKDGLTAQEYADGAVRFERDGDFENAYKAHQVAQELFQAEQGRAAQMQGVEAEYQWRVGMQEAIRANPEIGNPESPISGHLERIISQNPWIYHVPQGFQRAAEVADMLTKMGSISELQDENEQLRAELEKYRHKSQPAKGGFAAPRLGEKDFDEMDLNEMEAHLKSLTAEADNYR